MKFLISKISFIFVFSFSAQAEVPYAELDDLRKLNVVINSLDENPVDKRLKDCLPRENISSLRKALENKTEKISENWKASEILASDIPGLKSRIHNCEHRGSCEIYDVFLNVSQAAKNLTDDVLDLKSTLEKKMSLLSKNSYQAAAKEIPDTCKILKTLF